MKKPKLLDLRRITSSGQFMPQVDGIRFIAIISVIIFHSTGFYTGKNSIEATDWFNTFATNGYQGVELFFVLSGFILSLPFARKYNGSTASNFSVRQYFARRLTRLEPPYVISTVLLFLSLVEVSKKYSFEALLPHLLASLTYTSNIIFGQPRISVVLWSLEIEVQFYILAPILCWLLFKKIRNFKRRSWIIIACILFLTIVNYYIKVETRFLYQYITFFLTGILLANLYLKNKFAFPLISRLKNVLSIILLLIVFTNSYEKSGLIYNIIFPFLIFSLFFLLLNLGALKWFLEKPIVYLVGGACYSIYLLHYPIISFIGNMIRDLKVSANYLYDESVHITIYLLCVLAISFIFYLVLERPFMNKEWPYNLYRYFKNRGTSKKIKLEVVD